jgi:predicted class III extradiol MEMO1 family dioxygenase
VRVLHRTHSGEITGDNTSVVGYLTAVIQLPGTALE